jgi:hypothetical protein
MHPSVRRKVLPQPQVCPDHRMTSFESNRMQGLALLSRAVMIILPGFFVNSPVKRRVVVGPMQGPFEFLELKLPEPLTKN